MAVSKIIRLSLVAVALLLGAACSSTESGWILAEGGSDPLSPIVAEKFRALAGGPDAPVLVVTTALNTPELKARADEFAAKLGIRNFKFFNARDRDEANSDAFAGQINNVRGVWFTGGRPGFIAEAYIGTKVETELHALFERGGVIGGSSAGAMILGSFLLRGGTEENDLRTEISSRNQRGFAFLAKTVIDPHVSQRHSEAALSQIIATHPGLLGLGIDAGTALVVHADVAEVIGGSAARVTVTDGREHNGMLYYFLKVGDHIGIGGSDK